MPKTESAPVHANVDPCIVNEAASACCSRGTKGCDVEHGRPGCPLCGKVEEPGVLHSVYRCSGAQQQLTEALGVNRVRVKVVNKEHPHCGKEGWLTGKTITLFGKLKAEMASEGADDSWFVSPEDVRRTREKGDAS